MKRLQNKVAVITGGNSGIGKGIAEHFFNEGANVVIFGRDKALLDQAKQEMNNSILAIQGDVTHTDDLKKLYEQTVSHAGKIDILVVNSGVGSRTHTAEVTEDDFDYMVNINYRGAYFTVKYALPYLKDGASIIMIASTAAHLTLKHQSVYASTKAAVLKLANNFAIDLASRFIRVNSISPGYIKTPIFDSRIAADPDYLARRIPNVPLKRIGLPKDIAHAALFLASEEASYITGTDLIVDGGYGIAFRED